jgi:hypothetical protein
MFSFIEVLPLALLVLESIEEHQQIKAHHVGFGPCSPARNTNPSRRGCRNP